MKSHVRQTIDAHASELEALARQIFAQPELGFKEHRTASLVHGWFERLGLQHTDGIAVTGTRANMAGGAPRATGGLLGGVGSPLCWGHPPRGPRAGAGP